MHDLTNSEEAVYQKFGTHVEFITKVMHLATTILYFLQANTKEKESSKENETIHSLYIFLVDDWLKTLLKKKLREGGPR